MAKKQKQPRQDIDVIFAAEKHANSFVTALEDQFPTCKFRQDNNSVAIWAPKKDLPQIRLLTESEKFCRRSFSLYTAI